MDAEPHGVLGGGSFSACSLWQHIPHNWGICSTYKLGQGTGLSCVHWAKFLSRKLPLNKVINARHFTCQWFKCKMIAVAQRNRVQCTKARRNSLWTILLYESDLFYDEIIVTDSITSCSCTRLFLLKYMLMLKWKTAPCTWCWFIFKEWTFICKNQATTKQMYFVVAQSLCDVRSLALINLLFKHLVAFRLREANWGSCCNSWKTRTER